MQAYRSLDHSDDLIDFLVEISSNEIDSLGHLALQQVTNSQSGDIGPG
jgi:hypothetical protein